MTYATKSKEIVKKTIFKKKSSSFKLKIPENQREKPIIQVNINPKK